MREAAVILVLAALFAGAGVWLGRRRPLNDKIIGAVLMIAAVFLLLAALAVLGAAGFR